MHRLRAGNAIRAAVAQSRQVEARQQMFAGAKQNRRYRHVHFIHHARLQILTNGGGTAKKANVQATCCLTRALQRHEDPLRDEVKDGVPFHFQRRPRVMREYENGRVIGWILAPPAAPGLVRPGASDRAEHVATHYPCPDIFEAASREVLVDAGVPTLGALHPFEGAGAYQPVMQFLAANAERSLLRLGWACAVSVEGNRVAANEQSCH